MGFIRNLLLFLYVLIFEHVVPALPFLFYIAFFAHLSLWLYYMTENPLSEFYIFFSASLSIFFAFFTLFLYLIPSSWSEKIVKRILKKELRLRYKILFSFLAFAGIILYYFITPEPKEVLMRKKLDFYDTSTKYQKWLMEKLNAPLGKAYPYIPIPYFIYYELEDESGVRVVPFGMVSKSLVILCNESGRWVSYYTDRFGFRNPDEFWEEDRKKDILFLGNSFAQGWCVENGETYADELRNKFNYNVISLSGAGADPLISLGMLREYGRFASPTTVIYMYAEANDLANLSWSWKNQLLRKYLNPDFSQNLTRKVEETDYLIDKFIKWYIENDEKVKLYIRPPQILDTIKVWEIRFRTKEFRELMRYFERDSTPLYMIDIFAFVVEKMKEESEKIGADFLVVYLPDWYRFARGFDRGRRKVLSALREKGINFIDLTDEFSKYPDPLTFFPFRRFGHYNQAGHKILAEKIAEYLSLKAGK